MFVYLRHHDNRENPGNPIGLCYCDHAEACMELDGRGEELITLQDVAATPGGLVTKQQTTCWGT